MSDAINSLSSTTVTKLIVDAEHPWIGLNAYTEETQAYFFGRDTEICEMYSRVRQKTLTILYGPSGWGKSSLLGAGLIPKLKVERFRPILVRLDYRNESPPLIEQTKAALNQILGQEAIDPTTTLWEALHDVSKRPVDLNEYPPVLIFDQFEEIFTKSSGRQEEVLEWLTQISDLIENRPPTKLQKQFRTDRSLTRRFENSSTPVRVVLTLREDYLSHLERWKRTMPSLMLNRMTINLLSGPQALEATVRPGSKGGRSIVSESVAMQIVRKVSRSADDTPIEMIEAVPPFLSLLCEQLNQARLRMSPPQEQITSKLVAIRGDNILDVYYEECFAGLPEAVRYYVEDRLVSGRNHRTMVTLEDVESDLRHAGVSDPAKAVELLVARRLLTCEDRDGISRLELTHDVLVALVVRSRNLRLEREKLQESKRRELQAMKESRLRKNRQTKIIATLICTTLVFAGLAIFSLYSYRQAENNAKDAVGKSNDAIRERARADKQTKIANENANKVKEYAVQIQKALSQKLAKEKQLKHMATEKLAHETEIARLNSELAERLRGTVVQFAVNEQLTQKRDIALSPEILAKNAAIMRQANQSKSSNNGKEQAASRSDPNNPLNKFKIAPEIQAQYPELVKLVVNTESMDNKEKQYWFDILPSMTDAQVDRLFEILETERIKLEKLEIKYQDEIRGLNEKHLSEWQKLNIN